MWEEHKAALEWWFESGNQCLKFNDQVCSGLDIAALESDARMSSRKVNPEDYRKVKIIASVVSEHINKRSLS